MLCTCTWMSGSPALKLVEFIADAFLFSFFYKNIFLLEVASMLSEREHLYAQKKTDRNVKTNSKVRSCRIWLNVLSRSQELLTDRKIHIIASLDFLFFCREKSITNVCSPPPWGQTASPSPKGQGQSVLLAELQGHVSDPDGSSRS